MADYRTDEHGNLILEAVYPEDLVNRVFEVPDGVTVIGVMAFPRCTNLTSVVISNSVKVIKVNAFCLCTNLTSVVIPDGVTAIEEGAFESCTSLISTVIPDNVMCIGEEAFDRCRNLKVIAIDAEGDELKRIKGLLPDDLQGEVLSVDEYNQIKAVQVKAYLSYLAERMPGLLPADIWGVVAGLGGIPAINTLPLPNPKEVGWEKVYSEALSEVFPPAKSLTSVEERETKSQSFALSASWFHETKRQEQRPQPTPDSDASRCSMM